MDLLADLADSALSEWLSISMLGFPTLIALHSVGMAVVVGLSLMVALRLHGMLAEIDDRLLTRLLGFAVWGFLLNFVTGLALFITRGPDYLTSFIFLLKMFLVLLSTAILFWLKGRFETGRLAMAGGVDEIVSRRLALVGTASWFAAVVAGRMIAYLTDLYR